MENCFSHILKGTRVVTPSPRPLRKHYQACSSPYIILGRQIYRAFEPIDLRARYLCTLARLLIGSQNEVGILLGWYVHQS